MLYFNLAALIVGALTFSFTYRKLNSVLETYRAHKSQLDAK